MDTLIINGQEYHLDALQSAAVETAKSEYAKKLEEIDKTRVYVPGQLDGNPEQDKADRAAYIEYCHKVYEIMGIDTAE